VSGLFSSVLDGSESISLTTTVTELDTNVIASAGAYFTPGIGEDGMPQVYRAGLNLSPGFARLINELDHLPVDAVEVLVHEMLHILGINGGPQFANLRTTDGENVFFAGAYASAINDGPVLLAADGAHVANAADVIYPEHKDFNWYWAIYEAAPFSPVDLAILKDLGWQNIDTIVSADGHTFLPGNGKPGHNSITGTTGTDTVFINDHAAEYSIKATTSGYTLTDKTGDDGVQLLTGIERILFSDFAVALDTGAGQVGGEVYRMYQAAFNRAPDSAGLGFWIDKLEHGGWSLQSVAAAFKSSDEFIRLYGSDLQDSAYITQFYANVLHRAPEAGAVDFWVGKIHEGFAREQVMIQFSESTENITKLVGVLQDGFAYTPFAA
jgi:hypothetical protein